MISEFENLIAVGQSWVGTPFLHMGDVKGGGVDCTRLVGKIFEELGLITKIETKYYNKNWFDFFPEELVIKEIVRHLVLYLNEKYDFTIIKFFKQLELIPGDVIGMIWNQAQVTNHTVLMLSTSQFIHVVDDGLGVRILTWEKYWQDKANLVFRLKEPA